MGPGEGICSLDNENGSVAPFCDIACGAQHNLPDDCPPGLTCKDKFDAKGVAGADGKNDICAL
jgi:hypothetical protein